LIAGLIGLCVVVGLIAVTMIIPLPSELEDYRPILWALGFVAFLGLFTVGAVGVFWWINRQRANQFDAAFTPLGLSGSGYLTNGRQYHGLVGGRQVDVYFYRGPVLDIYVAAPLRTRMGIGGRSGIGSLASMALNRPTLQTGDPDLDSLSIYPIDEYWARELLGNPRAKTIILRLMVSQTSFEIRNLLLQPESIQLKLHRTHPGLVTPDNVRSWLNNLIELARIAEDLPAPTVTAQSSDLERSSRTDRGKIARVTVLVMLGVFALLLLCSLLAIPMGIWLAGGM
jgi:hypothetical protein